MEYLSHPAYLIGIGVLSLLLPAQIIQAESPTTQQHIERVWRAQIPAIQEQVERKKLTLRQFAGRTDLSEAGLIAAATRLDDQYHEVELEIISLQARQEALREAITRLNAEIREKVADDPIAAELQTIVKAHEEELSTDPHNHSVYPSLARAKANLLERRKEAAREAGGELLKQWNQELHQHSINLAAKSVLRDALDERRKALRDTLANLHELQRLEEQLEYAKQFVTTTAPPAE